MEVSNSAETEPHFGWCSQAAVADDAALAKEIGGSIASLNLFKTRRILTNEKICRLPRKLVEKNIKKYSLPGAEMPKEWGRWRALRDLNDDGTYDSLNLVKANLLREGLAEEQRGKGIFSAAGISLEKWESLGPTVNIGGRIRAIFIHPKNNKLIFAGSASGGIWISKDRAESWNRAEKFQGNLAISSFAYSENCTNDDGKPSEAIFAGTGEMETGQVGAGVLVSYDKGETWKTIPGTSPWRTGEEGILTVKKIIVNPKECEQMAILVNKGPITNTTPLGGFNIWQGEILVSNDQGKNWAKLADQSVPSRKDLASYRQPTTFSDIALAPSDPKRLLAVSDSGILTYYDNWQVFPSNGVTRTKALYTTNRFANFFSGVINPRIAVSPTSPMTVAISAGRDIEGTASILFYSSNYESEKNWGESHDDVLSQPFYANSIAIDANDPKSIIVGGLDSHQFSILRIDSVEGNSVGFLAKQRRRLSNWECGEKSPHADIQIILQDPIDPKRIYLGTDGGIYSTDDVSQAFGDIEMPTDILDEKAYEIEFNKRCVVAGEKWRQHNNGLSVSQFYHATSIVVQGTTKSEDKIFIAGGLQDNGTVFYDATIKRWKQAFPGDGGQAGFSADGKFLFGTGRNLIPFSRLVSGLLERNSSNAFNILATDQCGQDELHPRRSTGGILEDSILCQSIPSNSPWQKSEFIAPFLIVNDYQMYGLAAGHNLWRSKNLTEQFPNWERIFFAERYWGKAGIGDDKWKFIPFSKVASRFSEHEGYKEPSTIRITAIASGANE